MTNRQNHVTDVVIVGAGPYGLSIAAHLKALGVDFRIFGNPMQTWLKEMPKGMHLKSEGFASFLIDPDSTFTLADYCKEEGLPYADVDLPVPLETFAAYGLAFQKKFLPELENKKVVSVQRSSAGFEVTLEGGEIASARKVVMAVGISHFGYVPEILAKLPEEFVTHSSKYSELGNFKGKEVTVVGAGSSAVDIAALLHQAGAKVQIVARASVVRFHDAPGSVPTPWPQGLRAPRTGLGTGWRLFFCTRTPGLFRLLPEAIRLKAVRKTLGPAPGWFVKDQVVGKVPIHLGVNITQAKVENGRVSLEIADGSGVQRTITSDHVIAGTGYRVDLRRLTFLDADVQAQIKAVEHTPILSSTFESSVRGLYFVGTAAANSFGPLLRFVFGAGFTARHISKHLKRSAVRNLAVDTSAPKLQALERN